MKHALDRCAFRKLQPGDPWTMILDSPISGAVVGGFISKWFATNEPGRVFRVTASLVYNPSGWTPQETRFVYETVFVGFEECLTQPA